MRKSDSKYSFPYRKISPLSNPDRPWLIIRWPHGLGGLPVAYPYGTSFEEVEEVRKVAERMLTQADPGPRE